MGSIKILKEVPFLYDYESLLQLFYGTFTGGFRSRQFYPGGLDAERFGTPERQVHTEGVCSSRGIAQQRKSATLRQAEICQKFKASQSCQQFIQEECHMPSG